MPVLNSRGEVLNLPKFCVLFFRFVMPCILLGSYKGLEGEYTTTFVLMREAVCTSEILVTSYQTTRYHYPQNHIIEESPNCFISGKKGNAFSYAWS
jgi:hypothetical protein